VTFILNALLVTSTFSLAKHHDKSSLSSRIHLFKWCILPPWWYGAVVVMIVW